MPVTLLRSRLRDSWTLRCDCPLREVPSKLMTPLVTQLRCIADDLAAIDDGSGVWNIVRCGELHIELGGWRFAYRIPHRGVLAVVGAHQIPARGALSRHA